MSFTSRIKIEDLINNGSILVHKDGNHGAKYPRTEEFGELGVPFLTAKLLDNSGNIDLLKAPRLAKEKAQKFTFGFVQPEDVLLSHNATVGRVAVMPQVDEPILIGTSLTHFRLDKSKILPTYLAAYFSGKDFQDQLAAVMSQTTRNQVPITSQRKLYIELPSIEIQAEIVKYIDSIDNKIRLNNKINQTLESIAQAIFKSWFIDFDPVRAKIVAKQEGKDSELAAMCAISGKSEAELKQMSEDDFAELQATAALFPDELVESELGDVPKGWEVKALDRIASYQNGLALQKFRPEDENEFLPIVKIAQLKSGIATIEEKASPNIDAKSIIDNGDVVFSWSGSLVVDIWCGGKAALNQHLFKVTSNQYPKWLYYYYTKHHLAEFQRIAQAKAVTMGHIKREHLSQALCTVPCEKILDAIGILESVLQKQIKFRLENYNLMKIRDTLLPKLLSGEVSVEDIKQQQD